VTERFVVEGGDVGGSRHDGLDVVNRVSKCARGDIGTCITVEGRKTSSVMRRTLLAGHERLKEADASVRQEAAGGGEGRWVGGSGLRR
jgi:hypothetical protein